MCNAIAKKEITVSLHSDPNSFYLRLWDLPRFMIRHPLTWAKYSKTYSCFGRSFSHIIPLDEWLSFSWMVLSESMFIGKQRNQSQENDRFKNYSLKWPLLMIGLPVVRARELAGFWSSFWSGKIKSRRYIWNSKHYFSCRSSPRW